MTKVIIFERLRALVTFLFSLFVVQWVQTPMLKIIAIICAIAAIYALLRSVLVFLPAQRNKLKYLALQAESKAVIFYPTGGGYVCGLLTQNFSRTPETGFGITEAQSDAGGIKLSWDKKQVGVLREPTGKHVQTFAPVLTPTQTWWLLRRLVKADQNGEHVFNAHYLMQEIDLAQLPLVQRVQKQCKNFFYSPPTLSVGADIAQNGQNSTMVFAFLCTCVGSNLLLTAVFIFYIFRHIYKKAYRLNRRRFAERVILLTSQMLAAEKRGDTQKADAICRQINTLL